MQKLYKQIVSNQIKVCTNHTKQSAKQRCIASVSVSGSGKQSKQQYSYLYVDVGNCGSELCDGHTNTLSSYIIKSHRKQLTEVALSHRRDEQQN